MWKRSNNNYVIINRALGLHITKEIPSLNDNYISIKRTWLPLTNMTSSAGRIPMLDKVLKKASLFWGCNVWENAQNSLRKFTCQVEGQVKTWENGGRCKQHLMRNCWEHLCTSSCLLSSSVASSVSCAKRSVRNFSSSWYQKERKGWVENHTGSWSKVNIRHMPKDTTVLSWWPLHLEI